MLLTEYVSLTELFQICIIVITGGASIVAAAIFSVWLCCSLPDEIREWRRYQRRFSSPESNTSKNRL